MISVMELILKQKKRKMKNMTDEEFAAMLQYIGTNEVTLRDTYDAVFHLVTAAKGTEKFYTTANNRRRLKMFSRQPPWMIS